MIAVVTCHFNWMGYHTPVRNLARFQRQMQAHGLQVFGVELFLHGTLPRMLRNPNWRCLEVGSNAILFQKERLLNLAVNEIVPPGYDAIACLDHDIAFSNFRWHQDAERALERYPIIQPFETCWWTDRLGVRNLRRESCAKLGMSEKWHSHPGFGWVMRRDFWTNGPGFYDKAVLGSGDTAFACAALQTPLFGASVKGVGLPQHENGLIKSYFEEMANYNAGVLGWIKGDVVHEWHGDYSNRSYATRAAILEQFDALTHITLSDKGYWEWSLSAPSEMKKNIKQYFAERKEDG